MATPLDEFYFNFAKIGIVCDAGFAFSDTFQFVEQTGDAALDDLFAHFSHAFKTNDFAPVFACASKLKETYPDLAPAELYIDIFTQLDNTVFARFSDAALMYRIIEEVKQTGIVREPMKRFLGNELSVLTPDHAMHGYMRAFDPALDPVEQSADYQPVTPAEMFPGVTPEEEPLEPQLEERLKKTEYETGISDLLARTKEKLAWYRGLLS